MNTNLSVPLLGGPGRNNRPARRRMARLSRSTRRKRGPSGTGTSHFGRVSRRARIDADEAIALT